MTLISISAHFDGERIFLDEPVKLEPNSKLIVTVLPARDSERESWLRLSSHKLEDAYGEDEEDYSLDSLREVNTEYEGR